MSIKDYMYTYEIPDNLKQLYSKPIGTNYTIKKRSYDTNKNY